MTSKQLYVFNSGVCSLLLIAMLLLADRPATAKIVQSYTGDKSSILYGIKIDGEKEIYRYKKVGIIWLPYDPETGELLDPLLAPYLHYSQLDSDPDCSWAVCPTLRTYSIRYAIPHGHYVMGQLFIFSDNMGVGAYAQIEDLTRGKTNVRDMKLPRISLTARRQNFYLGDFVFKPTFRKKTEVPVGLLDVPSTEYTYTLTAIHDGYAKLNARAKDLRIGSRTTIERRIENFADLGGPLN